MKSEFFSPTYLDTRIERKSETFSRSCQELFSINRHFLYRSESFSSWRGWPDGHLPQQADQGPRGQVSIRDEQLPQATSLVLL